VHGARPVGRLLDLLDGVRRSGEGWSARCPAHQDRHASLSVGEGADGQTLLHCHAGCTPGAVVSALGLTLSDLFVLDGERSEPSPRRSWLGSAERRRQLAASEEDIARWRDALTGEALVRLERLRGWTPDAVAGLELGWDGDRIVFPIRDAEGVLVGVQRYEPDRSGRDGGPKMVADVGSRRELFPPPEKQPVDGGWLFVVEGEPDALRARSLGLAAISVPGVHGWRPEWRTRFAGRRVVIVSDCDRPGREAARRVASDLAGVAADVRVLDLRPDADDGFDLSDFLAPAITASEREEARGLLEACAARTPSLSAAMPGAATPENGQLGTTVPVAGAPSRLRFSWGPEFVAKERGKPRPALLGAGSDCLLPVGALGFLDGAGGSGKSTLAIHATAHLGAERRDPDKDREAWLGIPVRPEPVRVAFIENEGPRDRFRDKVQSFSEDWHRQGQTDFLANVVFLEEPWGDFSFADEGLRRELREFVVESRVELLVANPLGRLGMAGVGTPEEVQAFVGLLRAVGMGDDLAVLLLHHPNKQGQLSGAWDRDPDLILRLSSDPYKRRTTLRFAKTRWGDGGRAPLPLLWLPPDSGVGYTVVAQGSVQARAASRADKRAAVLAFVREHPRKSSLAVEDGVGGSRPLVDAMLKELWRDGEIRDVNRPERPSPEGIQGRRGTHAWEAVNDAGSTSPEPDEGSRGSAEAPPTPRPPIRGEGEGSGEHES